MVSSLLLWSVITRVVSCDENTLLQSVKRIVESKECTCGQTCQESDRSGVCLNNGKCDQRPSLQPVCGQDCNLDSENAMGLACKAGLVLQDYCGSQHEGDDVKNTFSAERLESCDCLGDEQCRVQGCEDVNGPPHLCSSTCSCTTQNLLQSGSNATRASRGAQQTGDKNLLFNAYDAQTGDWKIGLVNYMIDSDMPSAQKTDLQQAIKHWEDRTCIKFVLCWNGQPCDPAYDLPYMRFRKPATDGCNSPMGVSWTFAGDPMDRVNIINLGPSCTRGHMIHEIGHSLGLAHEHVRSDRDEFVRILWNNIDTPAPHGNFLKTDSERGRDIYKYDHGSIMHYNKRSFGEGRRRQATTIQTFEQIGQRNGLSATDIASVNFMYNNCNWNSWPGQAPTCVHSRQTPTQNPEAIAKVGEKFEVDFAANFQERLTSSFRVSPTPRARVSDASDDGQVAHRTVSFTPSSHDEGTTFTISATFRGGGRTKNCDVIRVKVYP